MTTTSPELQRARDLLTYLVSKPDATMDDYRALYDEVCANFELPADAEVADVDAGGVPSVWVAAPGTDPDTVIIHVHGGGFCMGAAKGYRELGYRLSRSIGGRSLVVDYRLAPEHPFPAPVDDVVSAYRFVRSQPGVARVVLTGDSAGGGMVMSALIRLREDGDRLPEAAVVMSPLVDLAAEGASITERADRDPLPAGVLVAAMGGAYRGADIHEKHPIASPLYGDLTGLPPTLVLVGTDEGLHDDSVRLAERLRAAGVETELVIGEGMIHIWPVFSFLPEAVEATDQIGAHVRDRLATPA